MSNSLAIATVTAALQGTLTAALQADPDLNGATVSNVRPAEGQGTGLPATGANIFLYQVVPNPQWRNADLPTRRPDGNVAQRPQAALDLHYLLSFYGTESQLEPQRLLGRAIAHLHSQPLLDRVLIQNTINDAAWVFLATSNLAEQVDVVRLAPLTLTLEELSRIWSVFFQTRYVLSVAYQASVVLVEPSVQPSAALPARAFSLRAVPLRQPTIRRIVAQAGETVPIVPGSVVVIEGMNLRGEVTDVQVNGVDTPITSVSDDRIVFTLPGTVPAGAVRVQVRHSLQLGDPATPHTAFASNLGTFALQPEITQTGNMYDIAIGNVQDTGGGLRSATVTIDMNPTIGPQQTVTLELLTAQGVAYTFFANPHPTDTTQVVFAIQDVVAGDYFTRIRVDGAESLLELDAQQQPAAPVSTIP